MGGFADLFSFSPPRHRLIGETLYLRPPIRRDWRPWAQIRADSRSFLVPWEPAWPDDALSKRAFHRRLARYAADWQQDDGYSFFLFRHEDNQLLGGIGLNNVRRGVSQTASVGYWLGQSMVRNGYMSEALRLILEFGFETLHLHRIEAACLPHNAASRGVLLKAGFREEGHARHYLCINNRWQDHTLFGQLCDEWRERRKQAQSLRWHKIGTQFDQQA